MTTTTFTRDLLRNEQAEIVLDSGTVYQIVQIDGGIYFGVKVGGQWSPTSPFRYAEGWRDRTGDYRPWHTTFATMVKAFVAEAESEETA